MQKQLVIKRFREIDPVTLKQLFLSKLIKVVKSGHYYYVARYDVASSDIQEFIKKDVDISTDWDL